jgi:hypothetical protein
MNGDDLTRKRSIHGLVPSSISLFPWPWLYPSICFPPTIHLFPWPRAIIMRRNELSGTLYRDDPTIMAFNLINEPRCEEWLVGLSDSGAL